MADTPDSNNVLGNLVSNVRDSFLRDRTILSFKEYFNLALENPQRHLRSSAQYLVDMLHYNGTEVRALPWGRELRFKLFDAPFAEGEGRVVGQEPVQQALYRIFANFAREGIVNKLVLLHGPNGSAKSSIIRCLMGGLEHYSRLDEGAMYTFNWIFPSEKLSSGGIGFGSDVRQPELAEGSYAYLSADNIDARIPSDLHDHPFFLIPQPIREKLLQELLPEPDEAQVMENGRPTTIISDYLRNGDLSYKSRKIYDALLASYDGDLEKVLNHVQVERFYLSRRYRHGVATIEPQGSVDARIQQLTADRSLASLPKALQHLALYEPSGPLVDANRGMLEYSDLLKRPVEAFKYLLETVETARVSMDSFVLHLDMLYVGSTNETYLDAFKEHPDFTSFKGRMELVKVPYLLRYSDEREIYSPQITPRVVGSHVAPHAVDVAAMWAILTRMRRCDPALYSRELRDVIDSLTPYEKMRLYDTGEVPERLPSRLAKELRAAIPDIYKESTGYPNYEGRFGASAREIRTALLNAAHNADYKYLSPLAVFDEIRELLKNRSVYDFLRQEVVAGYHNHEKFLADTEELYISWIDDEVRESMGLAPEKSYEELFAQYVEHISHWVKNERLVDPTSGEYRDPDQSFMREIEQVLMGEDEQAHDFRHSVIGAIGARALEAPESQPDYGTIFRSYIQKLREDFYAKRTKVLRRNIESFLQLTAEGPEGLEEKDVEQAQLMLDNLTQHYGYNKESARDTVAYLLKKRYSE